MSKSTASLFIAIFVIAGVGQSETERDFTYPPGYMRREPLILESSVEVYNPDGILKVADLTRFKMKADIANYYHLENANEVETGVNQEAVAEDWQRKESKILSNRTETDQRKWWQMFRPIEY